ncbi:hypothetical protein [Bradyrhizobium uaiense]|uniref:Uncharacterized protein n=1 Tax=Bradyrhizobium uaiense TaxID=2594946 RepID=A0A6P1BT81_9BRAD|nr:hypothetical protein [Bradyrhizobium uaiense]NEV01360.1 hypothetical protein [Bradyrhizobium uaiense]
MTEPVNVFEQDLTEAVAKYMATYEKDSGLVGDRWSSEEVRKIWRHRAHYAIMAIGQAISSYAGHWNNIDKWPPLRP